MVSPRAKRRKDRASGQKGRHWQNVGRLKTAKLFGPRSAPNWLELGVQLREGLKILRLHVGLGSSDGIRVLLEGHRQLFSER